MARILICDADIQTCRFFQTILQAQQFEVELTHDAPACLVACQTNRPKLLVADLQVPGMDGLEMIRQLRQAHPLLPIIATSGASDGAFEAARENGADCAIQKPIIPTLLLATIRILISMRATTT